MGGLSQIAPSSAAQSAQVLPPSQQAAAQNQVLGNIGQLSGFARPTAANYFTNLQTQNPFAPQAQAGATTAAQFGGQAATNQFNLGGNLETTGQRITAEGQQLLPAAQQVFQTAFDPQLQQYQQYLQNVQQQQNAQMALSGVGATPYAAGLNSQQLQQFNIAWQAQQLSNQVAGLNAMTGAYGTAAGMAQTGAGISGAGAGLQAGAPQLAMQSAMYPYLVQEQIGGTGMGALSALQQYGTGGADQQQINDLLALLGQVPAAQNANTAAAQTQANIQNQNMQQLMKAIAGGVGVAAMPFTGGSSFTGALGSVLGPQNNPAAGGGMGGWGPM